MNNEENFPFSFPPYDVQKDFMKNLYDVLEAGKIGIFESPTGTGKSLSIICGSLKWLKDFQVRKKEELENVINEKISDTNDDWFGDFIKVQEKRHMILDAKKEFEFLTSHEAHIKSLRNKITAKKTVFSTSCNKTRNPKRMRVDDVEEDVENSPEDDFVIENSDGDNDTEKEDEEKEEKPNIIKIYFASRTHSQLAQFLGEIKRSPYGNDITVTTLGSRANLCINDAVLKFKNISLINEHCIELQKKKSKNKKCCPYIKNLSDLQENILGSVNDIEDIVQLGKEIKSCPYYASRKAIPDVELVVLPYNILLHKPTREAYGIVLKDNIVIIDEAHNLVEAVNNMYSSEISGTCLQQSFWQLETYYRCYSSRFSQKNIKFIKVLLSVLKSLIAFLKDSSTKGNEPVSKIMSCIDFISSSGVGNVNFFEVAEFCETSLIGHKLHGFTASRVAKGITPIDDLKKNKPCEKTSSTASFLSQIKNMQSGKNVEVVENRNHNVQYKPSAFFTFIEFIKTLTSPTDDGRILYCKANTMQKSFLKFLHLNPSSHFQDIVQNARSVILAGGTMQPISEFTDLFINSGISESRISHFSCGHVIPPENLLAAGIAIGPCGNSLDFTYKSRKLPETVKELGSVLVNICNMIRGGIVCFFPSYDYEEFIYCELEKNKFLDNIRKKKKIFREPKLSSDVDQVLSQYARCIDLSKFDKSSNVCNGAILFSIVGGKMSEGINFADDLGRCVVMVGLPYPNKFSVELKEKMSYLNQKAAGKNVKNAGDIYYNNLCMKAVNQSIGRAIRHRNDYATIVLLDYRYKTSIVKDALPGWILKSFNFYEKFGQAYFVLRKFYISKNK